MSLSPIQAAASGLQQLLYAPQQQSSPATQGTPGNGTATASGTTNPLSSLATDAAKFASDLDAFLIGQQSGTPGTAAASTPGTTAASSSPGTALLGEGGTQPTETRRAGGHHHHHHAAPPEGSGNDPSTSGPLGFPAAAASPASPTAATGTPSPLQSFAAALQAYAGGGQSLTSTALASTTLLTA